MIVLDENYDRVIKRLVEAAASLRVGNPEAPGITVGPVIDEAAYRRILREQPNNADALNFLGMLTCQTGNSEAAAELLSRSVKADANNPHAWLNFGNVLLLNGEKERALEAFEKTTQLAPKLPMAWFNLGVCLGRVRRPDEAASALHQALKLEPTNQAALEFRRKLRGM